MENKCAGCGALLQMVNKDEIGFTKKINEEGTNYCYRCFRLNNYGEFIKYNRDNETFENIISAIALTDDLIVIVIDIFSIPFDLEKIVNTFSNNKILFVLTKRDLFLVSIKESKIKEYFRSYNCECVIVSSKNNYNFDLLYDTIYDLKTSDHVYVVGFANSGKSSLINRFINNYGDDKVTLTTSSMPSTTISTYSVKVKDDLYLVDTPGIIDTNNMIDNFDSTKEVKHITPNSMIKPRIFDRLVGKSIVIEDLAKVEYLSEHDCNMVVYIGNDVEVSKMNLNTRNEVFENHEVTELTINEPSDIVINGLCFIKVKGKCKVRVKHLNGVKVFLRKPLI